MLSALARTFHDFILKQDFKVAENRSNKVIPFSTKKVVAATVKGNHYIWGLTPNQAIDIQDARTILAQANTRNEILACHYTALPSGCMI